MILDRENLARIRTALKFHPRGLNISEIAATVKINRNSAAKYLEILQITGQVEAAIQGPSKVYTISQKVPLSAMMNLSSGMILVLDHDGRIIQANDHFLQFAGKDRDEILGRGSAETGLAFLQDLSPERYLQPGAGKKEDILERKTRRSGTDTYLRITVVPTIFDNGDEGLTLFIDDITERRNAELALKEREKLYRSVIENIQDVFYRSDVNGNLVMASPSWATLLGYDTVDACIGHSIAGTFYIDPGKRKELLDILDRKGFVQDYPVVLKCRDGSPMPVSTNSHLYYDDAGQVLGVEGIFRDIRERCSAEKKIQTYITNMEFLSQKLMEFMEIPVASDLFGKIGGDLSSLVPGSVVIVGSYEPAGGTATIRAVMGQDARSRIRDHLGFDLVGLSLPTHPVGLHAYRSPTLEQFTLPVHEAAFRALPEETCRKLTDMFGIRNIFTIGLTRGEETLGGAVFFLPEGSAIRDPGLIETYVHQASIALQRRIAEESFLQSQDLFFSVAEQLPIPLAILDAKGKFTYINRSFSLLFGYNLEDFSSVREWLLLAFPDPSSRGMAGGNGAGETDRNGPTTIRAGQYVVRCRDGSERDVVILPQQLGGGKACIVFEDITSRREAENTRRFLSAIVTSTDDAIIGKKPDGTIISWNQAAERLYGYTADEMIGQNISVLISPELRQEMKTILDRIQHGESIRSLETERIRKDGERIEVAVTVSPIVSEEGQVIGASSIARDISGEKTEQRLKESEERYQALVGNINVGVYRSTGDPRGKFVWGNPSLFRILGYESLESLGSKDIADLFAEQGGREALLAELRQSGFVKNRPVILKKPDGTLISVLVTALATIAQDGSVGSITGIVEDITGRQRTERLIRTLEKEIPDILDLLQDPAYIINTAKNVVAWNTAMERFTGVPKEQVLGRAGSPFPIPLYGRNRPPLVECIGAGTETIRSFYPDLQQKEGYIETEIFSPDLHQGSGAVFLVRAAQLLSPAGIPVGSIEIIRDISDRLGGSGGADRALTPAFASYVRRGGPVRQMTAASDRQIPPMISLLYLSNALKLAHDGILIMDRSARCVWVNNSLIELFGLGESTTVMGKSIGSFVAADEHKLLYDRLFAIERSGPVSLGLSILTPSGSRQVKASVSHISDENGDLLGFMAIMRDLRKDG